MKKPPCEDFARNFVVFFMKDFFFGSGGYGGSPLQVLFIGNSVKPHGDGDLVGRNPLLGLEFSWGDLS